MTDTRVALGSDRLPWISDEPIKRRKVNTRELWTWGAAAILVVAGAGYWLGVQTAPTEPESAVRSASNESVTTRLPEPADVATEEQPAVGLPADVNPAPAPEVRPAPAPIVHSAPTGTGQFAEPSSTATGERLQASNKAGPARGTEVADTRSATPSSPPRTSSASSPRLWPSRVTTGAYGRVVQIGAFGSRYQAKRGWWHMARAYPGVKRLPAVVVETRNSKGRPFYRFQIGTTSQAHSEVLCQRMQKIRFSCAVVGLPWKPNGVER